jgi:hypothetical protein
MKVTKLLKDIRFECDRYNVNNNLRSYMSSYGDYAYKTDALAAKKVANQSSIVIEEKQANSKYLEIMEIGY